MIKMGRWGVRIGRKVLGCVARSLIGTITHVATKDCVVALTFDDGPHPHYTPRLLDILERYGAHATFFMVGEAVCKYPELVRRVAEAGHAIGNHSWNHPSLPSLTRRERRAQIQACARAIARYGGLRLFRPPYGDQTIASRLDALLLRHQLITWNCSVRDWCENNSDRLADALWREAKPGSIILLHDAVYDLRKPKLGPDFDRLLVTDREPMLRALDQFLAKCDSRFRFVTIPELLRCGRPQRVNWY
jgi:peptidoglycan/xylan/chitin deacetylase (PgdA/CDA1 family)